MKKQFLILFAFISALALSQVPQRFNKVIVTGDITSPKFIKTGSTADSVLLGNGSARAISTIKIDTTSLSNRINTKQEILVSGTNIRTVNGNSVLGSGDIQIVSGGGGSPVNNYLSNVNSVVSGYKEARPDIDVTETVKTITATPANTITWGEKYLYTSPVSTTIVPSGFWELHAYGHISTSTGVSKLVFRVLRYSGSTETILATFTGFEVNNTTDAELFVNGSTNDITVLAGDYLGIQVGFLSDGTFPARTLTYTIGDGNASHFNTPLPTRHSALRDKNGEVDFQHLTAVQVTKVNNTSGINTGDETLTSIKTKLGAASSVSDGYLRYQDFALLHTPTTVTASNGLSISGQNISLQNASLTQSGALTFNDYNRFDSKEPAIIKNTGFNLPLGNTTGTVLEGRTFGTAANSAVGDFQPAITGLTTNYIPKWNGSSFVNSLISDDGTYLKMRNNLFAYLDGVNTQLFSGTNSFLFRNNLDNYTIFSISNVGNVSIPVATSSTSPTTGALVVNGGIGADHVRANNFYGSGSNLTGVQKPITLTTNGTSGAATFENGVMNVPNYTPSSVSSGQFSPAVTNLVNCSSATITNCLYTNVGGVVTYTFRLSIVTTSATGTKFDIQLPSTATSTNMTMVTGDVFAAPVSWVTYSTPTYATVNISTGTSGSFNGMDFSITYK